MKVAYAEREQAILWEMEKLLKERDQGKQQHGTTPWTASGAAGGGEEEAAVAAAGAVDVGESGSDSSSTLKGKTKHNKDKTTKAKEKRKGSGGGVSATKAKDIPGTGIITSGSGSPVAGGGGPMVSSSSPPQYTVPPLLRALMERHNRRNKAASLEAIVRNERKRQQKQHSQLQSSPDNRNNEEVKGLDRGDQEYAEEYGRGDSSLLVHLRQQAECSVPRVDLSSFLDSPSVDQNNHIVSGLLITYLRELDEPILTNELYDCFNVAGEAIMSPSKLQTISNIIKMLPPGHLVTLEYIMGFVYRCTLNQEVTKMTVENIAIVLGPVLMRNSGASPLLELMDSSNSVSLIAAMLQHMGHFFPETCAAAAACESFRSRLPISVAVANAKKKKNQREEMDKDGKERERSDDSGDAMSFLGAIEEYVAAADAENGLEETQREKRKLSRGKLYGASDENAKDHKEKYSYAEELEAEMQRIERDMMAHLVEMTSDTTEANKKKETKNAREEKKSRRILDSKQDEQQQTTAPPALSVSPLEEPALLLAAAIDEVIKEEKQRGEERNKQRHDASQRKKEEEEEEEERERRGGDCNKRQDRKEKEKEDEDEAALLELIMMMTSGGDGTTTPKGTQRNVKEKGEEEEEASKKKEEEEGEKNQRDTRKNKREGEIKDTKREEDQKPCRQGPLPKRKNSRRAGRKFNPEDLEAHLMHQLDLAGLGEGGTRMRIIGALVEGREPEKVRGEAQGTEEGISLSDTCWTWKKTQTKKQMTTMVVKKDFGQKNRKEKEEGSRTKKASSPQLNQNQENTRKTQPEAKRVMPLPPSPFAIRYASKSTTTTLEDTAPAKPKETITTTTTTGSTDKTVQQTKNNRITTTTREKATKEKSAVTPEPKAKEAKAHLLSMPSERFSSASATSEPKKAKGTGTEGKHDGEKETEKNKKEKKDNNNDDKKKKKKQEEEKEDRQEGYHQYRPVTRDARVGTFFGRARKYGDTAGAKGEARGSTEETTQAKGAGGGKEEKGVQTTFTAMWQRQKARTNTAAKEALVAVVAPHRVTARPAPTGEMLAVRRRSKSFDVQARGATQQQEQQKSGDEEARPEGTGTPGGNTGRQRRSGTMTAMVTTTAWTKGEAKTTTETAQVNGSGPKTKTPPQRRQWLSGTSGSLTSKRHNGDRDKGAKGGGEEVYHSRRKLLQHRSRTAGLVRLGSSKMRENTATSGGGEEK